MENLLQTIRDLKTRAKNRRDLGRYESAAQILSGRAIPLIERELSSTGVAEWRAQLASELADCLGILGGIYRRDALESPIGARRQESLRRSYEAYAKGYQWESDRRYNIVNSYNLVNRIVGYILLRPESLWVSPAVGGDGSEEMDVEKELDRAEREVLEQLRERRRGDYWALADLALIRVLRGSHDPLSAYGDFIAAAPPDFAYESALATLRPLTDLQGPQRERLQDAVRVLEAHKPEARSPGPR